MSVRDKTIWSLLVLCNLLFGCGVDRLGDAQSRVTLLFEIDVPAMGTGGDAPRDDQGLFRLDLVGVFLGVRVTAPDMEDVFVDWPEEPLDPPPAEAELQFLVDAGEERTFDVVLFRMQPEGTVQVHGGRETVDELPGGQQIDLEMQLEVLDMAQIAETVLVPEGSGDVVSLHPVDLQFSVVYPEVTFVATDAGLQVPEATVAAGRDVGWALKLTSGDWVTSPTLTEVP